MFALTLSWPTTLAQAVCVLWTNILVAQGACDLGLLIGGTWTKVASVTLPLVSCVNSRVSCRVSARRFWVNPKN